jgi:hypothetical protein
MGRPLNHRYFGDNNQNATNNTEQTGGEGVASVAAVTGLTGMTAGGPFTIAAADITAPQIAGGKKAVLTFTATSATAGTVAVVSPGTGYTSAPTVTVRGALAGGSTTATPTATLTTSSVPNALSVQAITSGSTNRTSGNDIIRQTGSKRFQVRTQDGVAICKLVQATPAAVGEMAIVATDSASGTYWVRKITNRTVVLVQNSGSQFASGKPVKWTLGSAVNGVSVTLANA